MEKALLDLGASVNLLPYSMYKQLGLGELKPTSITLSLADMSIKTPKGTIEDVLIQVDKFYYLVDFVVLDTEPIAVGPNHVPHHIGEAILGYFKCHNKLPKWGYATHVWEYDLRTQYLSFE